MDGRNDVKGFSSSDMMASGNEWRHGEVLSCDLALTNQTSGFRDLSCPFTIPLVRSLLFFNGPMRSHISHISRPARLSGWASYEWRIPAWGLSELMIITGPGDDWGLSFKTLDRISNKPLTNNLTVERCSSSLLSGRSFPRVTGNGWQVTTNSLENVLLPLVLLAFKGNRSCYEVQH